MAICPPAAAVAEIERTSPTVAGAVARYSLRMSSCANSALLRA
jgi:hypothetical protein